MRLEEALSSLERETSLPYEWRDREVLGLTSDSRKVTPGFLFVAVRGFHADGHEYISQAARQGALAVVAEKKGPGYDIPVIVVENSRRALALLADSFYGRPSRKLKLVGITGTNGKTTTTYLVRSVIEAAGRTAGLIGTIDYRIGNTVYPAPNTTPEAVELQRFLAEAARLGAQYCVMEVSSHALALDRTTGCVFETAGFTNLTQDHLDFHGDMESYFRAKLLLFAGLTPDKTAVINIDDERAAELIRATKAKVVTTGISERADVHPSGTIRHVLNGLSFEIMTPLGVVSVESPLVGTHNVHNILTAVGIGNALGFGNDVIAQGIKNMRAVPGRMEKVDEGQPYGLIVDYAHTEDALLRLLETVRELSQGRVITVFGCGGERDRSKRPRMGAAAINGSDVVIVTSDNPRSEDPMNIIREIETGMTAGLRMKREGAGVAATSAKKTYCVVPDRAEAIATAVRLAAPGDVVVLAGKGHENCQIIGEKKIRFDDREIAREEIRKRQNREGSG